MQVIGKNNYKLLLLDTNALREIITNKITATNFFLKFFDYKEEVPNEEKYCACISIYNVIELNPYEDIYKKFLELFSIVPFIILFPYKTIIQAECDAYIKKEKMVIDNETSYAFYQKEGEKRSEVTKFLNEFYKSVDLDKELFELNELAQDWDKKRIEFHTRIENSSITQQQFQQFLKVQEDKSICNFLDNFGINHNNIDKRKLPSCRLIYHSFASRLKNHKKEITTNEIMDIMINSICPYIDAFVTEAYQGELIKQAKGFIPSLRNLEIYRLKDIR